MLSIIIPTRNRANHLEALLKELQIQTIDNNKFEIIICDNNSSDSTFEVAERYKNSFLNFSYIKTQSPGLHVGRNVGYKAAKSDILVYCDDDILPLPTWLDAILDSFKDDEVVLVGGNNLPNFEIEPTDWALEMWAPNTNGDRVIGYFSLIHLGDQKKEISPYQVFGCNFSVRKKVIEKTSGFHPDGMPQDIIQFRGDGETSVSEYVFKSGYKTIFNPLASVLHFVSKERLTFDYLDTRNFNQGISDSYSHFRNQMAKSKTRKLKDSLKKHRDAFKNYILPSNNTFEISELTQRLNDSYNRGYAFHRNLLNTNKELRSWVLKENYLEYE